MTVESTPTRAIDAHEIRQAYLDYFRAREHSIIPPAGLVLEDDPTTLFTGSGMQALLPYLLGSDHPNGSRLVDSQPSFRAQDIEEVGDNRHTTFFEMLGNWSLGDYTKEEQIPWFFSFLVDVVGLDPEKLYVTCFIGDPDRGIPRDDRAAEIWQALFSARGIDAKVATIGSSADGDKRGVLPGERIFFYDAKENWWSRGSGLLGTPVGDPCGPDSEVFFDFGASNHDASYGLAHPASDSGQFMEIGNQVFMEYRRVDESTFVPLERKNVDFGGGLERIAAAALGTSDVYRTSLLWPLIQAISSHSGVHYEAQPRQMRVIADHIRGAVFLSASGVRPSNNRQGYVLRRLLRRAVLAADGIGITEAFFEPAVNAVVDSYADAYPALGDSRQDILDAFTKEELAFRRTLKGGLRALSKYRGGEIDGNVVFSLSDSYGFPKELTLEAAAGLDIEVSPAWADEYESQLEAQRQRSRRAS